jgi:hypothetical protein
MQQMHGAKLVEDSLASNIHDCDGAIQRGREETSALRTNLQSRHSLRVVLQCCYAPAVNSRVGISLLDSTQTIGMASTLVDS